jgi:hypothetical protein
MIKCPYCGLMNYDYTDECRKCRAHLRNLGGTVYSAKKLVIGPDRARSIRDKGLTALVLGLLIKVYWGGYGPWPVIDNPTLQGLRSWLEPLLIYVGVVVYALGIIVIWI